MSTKPSKFILASALVLTLYSTASLALGTDEQRVACTPDVFRLCSSEIPNVDLIVACLRREKRNLSTGCKAVFDAQARATETRTRSFATPESDWCIFHPDFAEPNRRMWQSWCGAAARNQ
jgi:hypothetical protein